MILSWFKTVLVNLKISVCVMAQSTSLGLSGRLDHILTVWPWENVFLSECQVFSSVKWKWFSGLCLARLPWTDRVLYPKCLAQYQSWSWCSLGELAFCIFTDLCPYWRSENLVTHSQCCFILRPGLIYSSNNAVSVSGAWNTVLALRG